MRSTPPALEATVVIALPILITFVVLLALSASISAVEAAILTISEVRLRHLAEVGHRGAQHTWKLLSQRDRVIGTLVVANSLVNVALSAIGTWVCITSFGPERGVLIATVAMTVILLLIGEVTPKIFGTTHPEAVAFAMIWPLRLLMIVLHPIATAFTRAAQGFLRALGIPTKRRSPLVTEEELKVMIQMGREEGILAESELRMLHRIFEFSDSVVREVMAPREQIAGVDLNAKPEEALDVLIEQGHSRIPVYRGSLDQVVGVIYARDMLTMIRHGALFVLLDLIRPIAFVKESKRIAELLSEFQRDKIQIAIVQDAKSRTVGLVTLEDVLEEIVGEIHEEAPKRR